MPVLRLSAKPLTSLTADTNGLSGAGALLGKSVTDLQSGVKVGKGSITGTLKYVTGYTGFSGDISEQSGNYLAIHATAGNDASYVTAEFVGGAIDHPQTLDEDGIIICRVTKPDHTLIFRAYDSSDNLLSTVTYDLSGLVLEEAT